MRNDQTATYLAECFWPGVTAGVLEELDARARQAAAATRGGRDEVRYHGTMLVPQDEVVFCFFDGRSAETVRRVAEQADVPFSRIVESMKVPMAKRPAMATSRSRRRRRSEVREES